MKTLPLRLDAAVVERVDEAWRSCGIKNRMEFFRRALGHYFAHLGAEKVAVMFETPSRVGSASGSTNQQSCEPVGI